VTSSRIGAFRLASVTPPRVETNPDLTARYLEDAAHFPGGSAIGVVWPASLEEVAASLETHEHILPVGAQSSLTGGATPQGDVVLSTERLSHLQISGDRVVAGAGVTLQTIQEALAPLDRWLPPVPTYLGATVGGAVATCAAGAATFKYGTVRAWVEAMTVVLSGGDVLEISRGQTAASQDGGFEIETSSGVRRVAVPSIRMPDVPKRSAGYFAAPGMDLIDLFIGSEGTLGVIASATLRTAPCPAATCRWLVPVRSERAAIALADDLRRQSHDTWATGDPCGIDIAAIEHLDARSLALVREDGVDRRLNLTLASDASVVLLIEQELSAARSESANRAASMPLGTVPNGAVLSRDLWIVLENALDPGAPDSPIARFCRTLDRHGALDHAEVALPSDRTRAAAFAELREAVPSAVNRRVALARQQIDPRISKTAADMIVPFDRFDEMMTQCRRLFAERNLDLAVWGHISDGNVHPNLIPKSFDDVIAGRAAILELGQSVVEIGGCPLAEHGVGRHPAKQELLRLLYGADGVTAMRRVKRALDPEGRLAPGVIFATQ
jgi:D-lactate dehydrogenase (cytochrome)